MLPIDPGDGQGSVTPAPPFRDIPVQPAQAMAHGSTIIRPGAVAWGGYRDALDGAYPSCEAVEQLLAAVTGDAGQFGALLAELTTSRLWVPLPPGRRPFTDGTAVVLPTVRSPDGDFIPAFTSLQRLTAWANRPPEPAADSGPRPGGDLGPAAHGGGGHDGGTRQDSDGRAAGPDEYGFTDIGRSWQRSGDSRVVPHVVVPADGLAQRLPPGTGLVLNPDSEAGLPLYPECVAYLARLSAEPGETHVRVGDPPAEPVGLLREVLDGLRALPAVRRAARAWLTVPGAGEGLVISVTLDDPANDADRTAVVAALERAVAEVPLHVPFPVDVTFPGEGRPDIIDAWVAGSAHPFYARG